MKYVSTITTLLSFVAAASAFSPSHNNKLPSIAANSPSTTPKSKCPFSNVKSIFFRNKMTGVADAAQDTLLVRLGGEPALRAAVDLFYNKLLEHKSFAPYFEGVSLEALKDHQFNFMSLAFTDIPDDLDVIGMIRTKHARLYKLGMDEDDFDIVAGDFVATLQELKVPQGEIDEAAGVVLPLRVAFEKE